MQNVFIKKSMFAQVKNIFIVGLDDYNLAELKSIENADQYHFIPLFDADEVLVLVKGELIDIEDKIKQAKQKLDQFEGTIDGIIGFFDPVMLLTFHLCQEYGLRGPSLISALRCEHKYLSRLEQKKVVPENIPEFTALDPFIDHKLENLDIKPPFWLKPVKSYGSQLGFKIENQQNLDKSLREIRKYIKYFAKPFNHMLSLVDESDLAEDVRKVDGNYCVAEGIISGRLFTVEGYVYDGEVHQHGFFDSIRYDDTPSFFAYITPSTLSDEIQERMIELTNKVMKYKQFDNTTFNIEYYYDEKADQIWLLEVNTRISQSHSELFKKVHGSSNHQFLVELAVGQRPSMQRNQGKYKIAAKLHPRVFYKNGRVTRVPSDEEIRQVEEHFDAKIFLDVEEGQELADMPGQDSFSSLLANIYLGARNKDELYSKYEEIVHKLDIKVQRHGD